MIRLVGAALVAAGCICMGESMARRLSHRDRALQGLCGVLEQMELELRLRMTPLPSMMEEMSRRCDVTVRPLVERCAGALRHLQDAGFSQVWPELLRELSVLEQDDRRILLPLGQILGRYDAAGQADSVASVRAELERQRQRIRADSLRLGRVYRAVGAAGGGFLIVLLL